MPFVPSDEACNQISVDLLAEAAKAGEGFSRIKLVGDPTIRAVLLTLPPGSRTVPHRHPRASELFLVQAGRLGFRLADEPELEAGPGTLLLALPDQMHGLRTIGGEAVRFIAVVGPNLDVADEQIEDLEIWPDWTAALRSEASDA